MTHFKIFKNGELISPNEMDKELCSYFKVEFSSDDYMHLGGFRQKGIFKEPVWANWVDTIVYFAGEGWEKFQAEYEDVYDLPWAEIEKKHWYINYVKPLIDYFKENQVTFETW